MCARACDRLFVVVVYCVFVVMLCCVLRSGNAYCNLAFAVEVARRRKRRAFIKSKNSHLAGEEKDKCMTSSTFDSLYNNIC